MKVRHLKYFGLFFSIMLFLGLYSMTGSKDIGLYDESHNLQAGVHFDYKLNDGTGYFLFIKILSLFEKDNVNLYFLNYIILSVILISLLFFSVRTKYDFISVSLFSLFIIYTNFYFKLWPFITVFSSAVIILLYLLLSRKRLYLFTVFSFYLVYVRPEFLYFYFTLPLVVFFAMKPDRIERLKAASLYLLLLSVILLNSPVSAKRSSLAFGQHYAFSKANQGLFKDDPWTNWPSLLRANFKESDSILETVLSNPSEFLNHVKTNIDLLSAFYSKIFHLNEFIIHSYFAIVIALICALLRISIKNKDFSLLAKSLFSVFISVPALAGILVIYPRDHYLLNFSVGLFLLLSVSVNNFLIGRNFLVRIFRFVLILTAAAALYGRFTGWQDKISDDKCSVVKMIHHLKYIGNGKDMKILNTKGSPCMYLDFKRCADIREYFKEQSFDLFVQKYEINTVIVNDALMNDPRFRNDPEFSYFLKNSRIKSTREEFKEVFQPCESYRIFLR